MYVLESFTSNHPAVDVPRLLTPQAIAHLSETRDRCITVTVTKSYWSRAIPKDQFLPGANLSVEDVVAAANDLALLRLSTPTFIAQGGQDDTVLPAWTDAVVRRLCASGVSVTYATYPEKTHETVVDAGALAAQAFVAALFAGRPPAANCADMPHAAPL